MTNDNILTHVEFDLTENEATAIAELMKICGLKSPKELHINAIALLGWAAKEVNTRGRVIASVDEKAKEYSEIRMAVLEHARAQAIQDSTFSSKTSKRHHIKLIYSNPDKDLTPGR